MELSALLVALVPMLALACSNESAPHFQRDMQPTVDQYLAGAIDQATFESTAKVWTGYATYWRQVVEVAHAAHRPLYGLNVPDETPAAAPPIPSSRTQLRPPPPSHETKPGVDVRAWRSLRGRGAAAELGDSVLIKGGTVGRGAWGDCSWRPRGRCWRLGSWSGALELVGGGGSTTTSPPLWKDYRT